MTISRFSQSTLALSKRSQQTTDALAGLIPLPYTPTIGTATDGGTGTTVSVAFTPNATVPSGTFYTALSSPGSITASGSASPITVSGLTSGTAYTFQVRASNATGNSAYSAASNSVTPAVPSSYESIATSTPSGVSTITFSSIPSTYSSLQIRYNIISATAADVISMQVNGDTSSNYRYHMLYGNNGVATATGAGSAQSRTRIFGVGYGTVTTYPNVGIIDIIDYASTTKNKTVRTLSGADNNTTTQGEIDLNSGLWMSVSAVTSLTIFSGVNFNTGSTIALYGVK
jgi:hypothetical protein